VQLIARGLGLSAALSEPQEGLFREAAATVAAMYWLNSGPNLLLSLCIICDHAIIMAMCSALRLLIMSSLLRGGMSVTTIDDAATSLETSRMDGCSGILLPY